jgi:hypothetical protein
MPELPPQSGTEQPQEEALLRLEGTLAEWVSAIQAALSLEAERKIAGRGLPVPKADCYCSDITSWLPDTVERADSALHPHNTCNGDT